MEALPDLVSLGWTQKTQRRWAKQGVGEIIFRDKGWWYCDELDLFPDGPYVTAEQAAAMNPEPAPDERGPGNKSGSFLARLFATFGFI